jgi:hypothetical protein
MQIKLFPVLDISIPQDNEEHIFEEIAQDTLATNSWKIWNIYTHTHKYGTMYNAYERNPDGSKGELLYDGDYSYEWGFDVGYYRTGPEVTFRYFPDNDLYEIDPRLGIIHEAGFVNTDGPDPVLWGLTSDEEMMVLGIQYVEGASLTGIEENAPVEGLRLYPNPTNGSFSINFDLLENSMVNLTLFDVVGKQVANLFSGETNSGMFTKNYSADQLGIAAGTYTVRIQVGEGVLTQKVLITN